MGDEHKDMIETEEATEETTPEETTPEETAVDEGKSIEEQYNEYFGDGEPVGDEGDEDADTDDDLESEIDEDDEDLDEGTDEDDEDGSGDDGDTDEEASEETAGVTETEKDSAELRKLRRMKGEMEKLAKAKGYESVEDMLADENGEDRSEVETRINSDELTLEEKAAAYDRMTDSDAARKREEEGKKVHDSILAKLKATVPEAAGIEALADVPNAEKFRDLVLKNKLEPKDAYAVVTADRSRAKVAKATAASGKAHLVPSKGKVVGEAGVPDSFMREARELYPDLTEKEIRKLYKKIV